MKYKRHEMIKKLIAERGVETQGELARLLNEAGFEVTQATVSRDIRELKLVKHTSNDGKLVYTLKQPVNPELSKSLNRVFAGGIISIDSAQNIIVIKTLPGMAMAIAAALDAMNEPEIIGSIAGDDTVFCAIKSEKKVNLIIEKLKSIRNMLQTEENQ